MNNLWSQNKALLRNFINQLLVFSEKNCNQSLIGFELKLMPHYKVLHLDKDKPFLEITQRILKLLGDFEVDTAQTVKEANTALNQTSYDVIISAYYLGTINGLDYYKQLRANHNPTPFILFTINDETALEAEKAGTPFVTKFGDPEKVFGKLAEMIRASKK